MPRSDEFLLQDILEAIENVGNYLIGKDFDAFSSEKVTRHAVLYNLEIMGEAIKNIPLELKEKTSEVNWKELAGLRDIIAHKYFNVDLELAWDVITNELPQVRVIIDDLLKSLTPSPEE